MFHVSCFMFYEMIFSDRSQAGKLLAKKLEKFRGRTDVVVLGLPRGGVVVAAEVARALCLPLDIVVPRKIGAPKNPEYAIGAITETGEAYWNEEEKSRIHEEWIEHEVIKEKKEAERRIKTYRGDRPFLDLKDRLVILVDDGIATGLTMKAAIKSVQVRGAKEVVVAAPTGARDSLKEIKKEADEIIVLDQPLLFGAVGAFYQNFPQVEDEEVIKILNS